MRITVCGLRGTVPASSPTRPSVLGCAGAYVPPPGATHEATYLLLPAAWVLTPRLSTPRRRPCVPATFSQPPAVHEWLGNAACGLRSAVYGVNTHRYHTATAVGCAAGSGRSPQHATGAGFSTVVDVGTHYAEERKQLRAMAATVTTTAPQNHRTWCHRTAHPAPRDATE